MDRGSETTKLKIADIGADKKSFGTFADEAVVDDFGFGVTKDLAPATVIDAEAEAQLVRKLDARLLPCLGLMFLFNSLDKTNLGNAKTAGLEKSLGLHGNQFNLLVIIFYIPYVWTAPFLAVAGKKIGVHRALPLMMATFGVATLGIAAVSNFTGLLVLRWLLGVAESAFFPLVIYYLTTFYRRGELARRMALFYCFSFSASALGGLLAVWTLAIRNGPLPAWKYLFILEGASTLLYSMVAFWWLPANAGAATFLDQDEKMLAYYRMQVDSSAVVNDTFVFSKAVKVLKHPTSWVILAIEACIGVPLMSVSLFLPVMISGLGYSPAKTNMLTVAPNLTGACMLLLLAYASDCTRHRFSFAALGFALTFTGFIIFATIDVASHANMAYFATFLMTAGTTGPSVILDIWYNNNIAVESQRILLTSLACPIANSMGLLSGSIFFATESPRYPTALRTTAAFGVTGCCLTLALGFWMMADNKRRDKRQGKKVNATEVPTTLLANGPQSDDYRWML